MGREFAAAAARWSTTLLDFDARPRIVAVADPDPRSLAWFETAVPEAKAYQDAKALLADKNVEAVYVAVPHHLHQEVYLQVIRSGRAFLGEKPFGIDLSANQAISKALEGSPGQLARCSSEFPFFPGATRIAEWAREGRFGRIIEVEAGFWHSSDLDPAKPLNWKRRVALNGEYGCMGDLGLHVLHLPLRLGWRPRNVRALLTKVFDHRPGPSGTMEACETWDNAILACEASDGKQDFPMLLSMKRVSPGDANTWFIRVKGSRFSAEFSTKDPKRLSYLDYAAGKEQAWQSMDIPHKPAYPTITGSIFEFGFQDAILQMWAAFIDELANGKNMRQPLHCATPIEAAESHRLFTAALRSQRGAETVAL